MSVEAIAFRVSLKPHGEITARQAIAVALAGPLACVVPGVVLWVAVPQLGLAWWYLAHIVLLLPCFGDGQAVVAAVRRLRAGHTPSTAP
ncbi:hypothetical protein [Sinomonas sp. ASV322]|uniref:hypothetical protein n=1 Tax=Sinomonas sp. ASV322 TaxID=3041920 RepID=UPI0027DCAE54|nr:hypothetical protein [Sinomonas sp. ASV322]MDQ4501784.1 hypothetical protein [Sinomonas sp. ASV322]